jgi:type VI protein secretion system component VasK
VFSVATRGCSWWGLDEQIALPLAGVYSDHFQNKELSFRHFLHIHSFLKKKNIFVVGQTLKQSSIFDK